MTNGFGPVREDIAAREHVADSEEITLPKVDTGRAAENGAPTLVEELRQESEFAIEHPEQPWGESPLWTPSERQLWQKELLRELGESAKGVNTDGELLPVTEQLVARELFLTHFRNALLNVSQSLNGKPLALIDDQEEDGGLHHKLLNQFEDDYETEGLGALSTVCSSFYIAGEDVALLQDLFETCRENMRSTSALLRSDLHYEQLFQTLYQISTLSPEVRGVVVENRWMGIQEDRLPELS